MSISLITPGAPGGCTAAALAFALTLLLATPATAREFRAEGADAGTGVGARYVALGGTGVALADDLYAAWHNPTGLAQLQGLQLGLSRQADARLQPLSFIGVAGRLPLAADGPQVGLAAIFYPRVHARASGAFSQDDFESIFLRYLLPGISGTFDGDIGSKTRAWRLAAGLAPSPMSAWSVGGYVERIDCRSDFCGVHANSNGYTESSTRAVATAFGLGWRHRVTPRWTWAAQISDVRTQLDIHTLTTDSLGTRERVWDARFPRKVAVEVAHTASPTLRWALQAEVTKGRYGRSALDIRGLRAGVEKSAGPWQWRAGALVPLKVSSSDTRELKLPAPLAPTLGLGWRHGVWALDAALYAHPLMSMHAGRARPAAELSLGLRL